MEQLTFEPPVKQDGELIFSLTLPGRLSSWNEILGMEHWQRYKFKNELANAFLYELRRSENDFSMKTTSAVSMSSIYAATLASYLQTRREQRRLKSRSKRQTKALGKKLELKSTDFDNPPF